VPLSCAPQPAACLYVMRFSVGELTHGSGCVWERLHPVGAACSRGIYALYLERVGSGAIPRDNSFEVISQNERMMCARTQFTHGISIRENADSTHARPTLRAAPVATLL
jgi:hypothetical protein